MLNKRIYQENLKKVNNKFRFSNNFAYICSVGRGDKVKDNSMRFEVVGMALTDFPNLKGKRFNQIEELTSQGVREIEIYDHEEGHCLAMEWIKNHKDYIPTRLLR